MVITCPACGGTGKLNKAELPIGVIVASVRHRLKMTQAELAEKVGKTRATIANIESGRHDVVTRDLRKFAEALSVTVEDLIP